MKIVVLQHDPSGGPQLLGKWLQEAGAELVVIRADRGEPIPTTTDDMDALICLGGAMGALDDEIAPWLPATRTLLAAAVADGTPTWGICLGAQLLAAATGGVVGKGPDGPEVGAYLTAKRDAAEQDPLVGATPMTPDVMHCHADVISTLPPGAVLLMSGTGYPHQAFRVGAKGWGFQFHIETTADTIREWAAGEGLSGRLGPELDDAQEYMGYVWRDVAHRFTTLRRGESGPGTRLPLVTR